MRHRNRKKDGKPIYDSTHGASAWEPWLLPKRKRKESKFWDRIEKAGKIVGPLAFLMSLGNVSWLVLKDVDGRRVAHEDLLKKLRLNIGQLAKLAGKLSHYETRYGSFDMDYGTPFDGAFGNYADNQALYEKMLSRHKGLYLTNERASMERSIQALGLSVDVSAFVSVGISTTTTGDPFSVQRLGPEMSEAVKDVYGDRLGEFFDLIYILDRFHDEVDRDLDLYVYLHDYPFNPAIQTQRDAAQKALSLLNKRSLADIHTTINMLKNLPKTVKPTLQEIKPLSIDIDDLNQKDSIDPNLIGGKCEDLTAAIEEVTKRIVDLMKNSEEKDWPVVEIHFGEDSKRYHLRTLR